MKALFALKVCLAFIVILPVLSFKTVNAQKEPDIKDIKIFSQKDIESRYKTFLKDKGFSTLIADINKKEFGKIENSKETSYSWGFSGKCEIDKKMTDVVMYTFDFVNKKGETATLLWCQIGTQTYKAYVLLPSDKLDLDAVGAGKEWFVDEKNNIQLAHSFFSCLARGVTRCSSCTASDKNCIEAAKFKRTVKFEIGPIKYSTTIHYFSFSTYASCAGFNCAICITTYALSCGLKVIG